MTGRRRERSLLARDADGSAGAQAWLTAAIAVLACVAALAGLGALAAGRAADGWAGRVGAEATVLVRPSVGEGGATAAGRAAEALSGVDGVVEAEALDRARAEALLAPWIGQAALEGLALPQLVAVRLDPRAPASAVSLGRALAAAGLDAQVDDHGLWRADVERAAGRLAAVLVAAFLGLAGATLAATAYVATAGVRARRGALEALILLGASDATLARALIRRFGGLGAAAGAAGALAAAVIAAPLIFIGGGEGAPAALPLRPGDLPWLVLAPLILGATAAATAVWRAAGGPRRGGRALGRGRGGR